MNSNMSTRVRNIRTGLSGKSKVGLLQRSKRQGMRRACAGFSFVELLIVMGIILVIGAMAVPALKDAIKSTRTARTVADIRTIGDAALGYSAEYGYAPNSLADIWYDKQMDAWGRPYKYLPITDDTDPSLQRKDQFDVAINKYFDLYSVGLDGETSIKLSDAQSLDDIVWAGDGVYMGVAANY